MATHDYVIDNSTGANVRADINNVLQAILTNNSSSSAPSTTAAYMWWADTSNGVLKIRNSNNNGWVELLQLDGTLTLEDGTATAPALAHRSNLNTGIFFSAANKFNVSTGGVERLELGATTIFNEDGADVDFRIEGDNNANLFYLDAGNDRIAIGTNSPQNNLHLHQADSGKCILQFTNTTTGTGATDGLHVGHVANENVAFWNHEDTDINIATNNTHRMVIKNDGLFGVNLGSGVDPLELVHMKGNLYITANSSTENEGNAIKFQTKTGGFDTSYGAAIHGLRVGNSSSYLRFDTGGQSERMRIDSDGRVLIGTTIEGEASADDLTIAGSGNQGITIRSGTSDYGLIYFSDATSGAGEYVGAIEYKHSDNFMVFRTGSAERMRIDSSGRVLIGHSTVTPVDNDANNPHFQVEGTNGNDSRISIRHNSTSNSSAGTIYLSRSKGTSTGAKTSVASGDALGNLIFMGADGTHDTRAAIIQASCDGTPGDNDMPGRLEFFTTPDGGLNATEKMRINSSGDLLIGTTSTPNGTSSYGSAFIHEVNNRKVLYLATDTSIQQTLVRFHNSNGQVGIIHVSGSTTTYLTNSDYRIKENATAISDGITRLKTLKPYRFNFIADKSTNLDGFFAHEVQSIVPEAISGTKDEVVTQAMIDAGEYKEGTLNDPIYQGIDQSKIVPLLTAALQEAIAKIEVLETKVAALEAA